ncbi:sugar ABC transporter ATP-binding protein [Cryptosporangium aurantiacum]|uniref:Simple sugar transport system ATP-binding protein n=1 Tax=Cryptosporangium aurantiacum TaxID=134849 RepID=A0A1M7Q438_9ACTN|nr:sugar ABC transporter ATP-binding protein [Cryptosporangium aurantiacum]SHN25008.1 simple sugar transport system ATP-binding protein [Cryptosporangium aurantiacum]
MSAESLVEAAHVTKRYGTTVALRDAGIVVRAGATHALVGRNGAGKSTLVSILTGLQAPDEGTVTFEGSPAPPLTDRDAWRRRVACVYQKSTIIPELTVAENLFLNRHPGRLIRWSALRRNAAELLATWDVEVDVTRPAGDLTVEQRQLVEIARALSYDARLIILDEPTAQLDGPAINRLFDRMRGLQERGVTFLFISHHLEEIYRVCDEVTVFRDAQHIVTGPVSQLPPAELVAAMTGDATALTERASRPPLPDGTPAVLEVDDLDGVTFTVRAGEVVGLAGGGGSGKKEIAETIVGLRRPHTGTVRISGAPLKPGSVPASLAAGVGLVPQDRHHQGFVPDLSIAENLTMTVPRRLGRFGTISRKRRDRLAHTLIDELAVKTPGPELPVSALSGGNQQKVVMGRALANDPKLLVLIQPTAGVDVRSKETLLGVVDKVREGGAGVLVASDELDDLRTCDRVLVLFQGRQVAEFGSDWSDHDLVAAMEGIAVDDH